jgi:hypothetical protein
MNHRKSCLGVDFGFLFANPGDLPITAPYTAGVSRVAPNESAVRGLRVGRQRVDCARCTTPTVTDHHAVGECAVCGRIASSLCCRRPGLHERVGDVDAVLEDLRWRSQEQGGGHHQSGGA